MHFFVASIGELPDCFLSYQTFEKNISQFFGYCAAPFIVCNGVSDYRQAGNVLAFVYGSVFVFSTPA